jgi:hypothetical protein
LAEQQTKAAEPTPVLAYDSGPRASRRSRWLVIALSVVGLVLGWASLVSYMQWRRVQELQREIQRTNLLLRAQPPQQQRKPIETTPKLAAEPGRQTDERSREEAAD